MAEDHREVEQTTETAENKWKRENYFWKHFELTFAAASHSVSPISSHQHCQHIYNMLFLSHCLACLRIWAFSSSASFFPPVFLPLHRYVCFLLCCCLDLFFGFDAGLTKHRTQRRWYWKENQWAFEAAVVLMPSQSPSALLLPITIVYCLCFVQKAALIPANPREGDVPVVPTEQLSVEDACSGWLSDSPLGL